VALSSLDLCVSVSGAFRHPALRYHVGGRLRRANQYSATNSMVESRARLRDISAGAIADMAGVLDPTSKPAYGRSGQALAESLVLQAAHKGPLSIEGAASRANSLPLSAA